MRRPHTHPSVLFISLFFSWNCSIAISTAIDCNCFISDTLHHLPAKRVCLIASSSLAFDSRDTLLTRTSVIDFIYDAVIRRSIRSSASIPHDTKILNLGIFFGFFSNYFWILGFFGFFKVFFYWILGFFNKILGFFFGLCNFFGFCDFFGLLGDFIDFRPFLSDFGIFF